VELPERLRGRCDLTGYIALRDRPLLHRENRLARIAIQHVEKPGLITLDDDWNI
jgi:hypothetical protein